MLNLVGVWIPVLMGPWPSGWSCLVLGQVSLEAAHQSKALALLLRAGFSVVFSFDLGPAGSAAGVLWFQIRPVSQ